MPEGSCWSMAATKDGGGYYVLNAATGRIFTYGDAVSYGQPADTPPYQAARLRPTQSLSPSRPTAWATGSSRRV